MCQCPLFKQFTTEFSDNYIHEGVFIVCVNVLFLSNSQQQRQSDFSRSGVYRMCQCPLFKQFTTAVLGVDMYDKVFIVCVNVLFLSNSQQYGVASLPVVRCLSYVSMSSF